MTRCNACDEPIADTDAAHTVHEDGCDDDDWCVCETLYVHPRCCRKCRPIRVPGQVEAWPEASTKPLGKRRSA